jgi:5-methylcytosine-specific restriction endonuclease McrA
MIWIYQLAQSRRKRVDRDDVLCTSCGEFYAVVRVHVVQKGPGTQSVIVDLCEACEDGMSEKLDARRRRRSTRQLVER